MSVKHPIRRWKLATAYPLPGVDLICRPDGRYVTYEDHLAKVKALEQEIHSLRNPVLTC